MEFFKILSQFIYHFFFFYSILILIAEAQLVFAVVGSYAALFVQPAGINYFAEGERL